MQEVLAVELPSEVERLVLYAVVYPLWRLGRLTLERWTGPGSVVQVVQGDAWVWVLAYLNSDLHWTSNPRWCPLAPLSQFSLYILLKLVAPG